MLVRVQPAVPIQCREWLTETWNQWVKSGLNRRIWLDLENQSGEWAQAFDRVWVITGPVTHPAPSRAEENLAERERGPKERSVLGDGLADHGEDLLGLRKL